MSDYEVIVIGIGSAGSRAAAVAHAGGARTLGIEGGERLGGLCILRGCMPTKTLLETAHRLHDVRDAERFGIRVAEPEVDFAAMMDRMRRLVDRFAAAKVKGIESAGYELLRGTARFEDPQTVVVDGRRISGDVFVLSTGSRVRDIPVPVEDGAPVLTSDDMFLLEAPPRSCISLGAGPVALEFSQWLARIGTEVTLLNRSPLLKHAAPFFGAELALALGEEMHVQTGTQLERIERCARGARVVYVAEDGSECAVEAEIVLNGLGRIPNWSGLGVEVFGWHEKNVPVDDRCCTPEHHVFVAGDALGEKLLLHEANLEGQRAGRNALRRLGKLEGELECSDPEIPLVEVIFTDPPFATCGRMPRELERDGVPYHVAEKRFPQQGRGIVVGARHGLVQLISEQGSGKILGCAILGPRADDLIHIIAVAMRLGATVQQLYSSPWYHPTLAEAFIEVARDLAGRD